LLWPGADLPDRFQRHSQCNDLAADQLRKSASRFGECGDLSDLRIFRCWM